MLINKLKIILSYIKANIVSIFKNENIEFNHKKNAFIMLAANYNNLGDIAITKAQEQFLKKYLPNDYCVNIVPVNATYKWYRSIKKSINKYSIITLIGGGNSGTLYEFIEAPRRFILKKFKTTKIISFPQTIFYENDKKSNTYKNVFVKLCNKCTDLTLCAREKQSFELYKSMFCNSYSVKLLLIPDIVFSLNVKNNICQKKGIGIIFRNDKEKAIDLFKQNEIINILKSRGNDIEFMDTCDVCVTNNGYTELDLFLNHLKSKKLVITDRLHGMILSSRFNIPCIVFNNNNNKIGSTYDTWLKTCDSIKLFENVNDFNLNNIDFNYINNETIDLNNMFNDLILCFNVKGDEEK